MRNAIERLHFYGAGARVLTKSGTRACRDFQARGADGQAGYAPALGSHPDDAFGATVTLVDDKDSRFWEPGAALPEERMEGLREAHRRGIPTWINMMPVIDPEQSLEIIRRTHEYVDLYLVAGMRAPCQAELEQFEWIAFADRVVELCRQLEVPCLVGPGDDSAEVVVFGETMTLAAMWEQAEAAMSEQVWRKMCSANRPQWRLRLYRPWTAARLRANLKDRCLRQWGLW